MQSCHVLLYQRQLSGIQQFPPSRGQKLWLFSNRHQSPNDTGLVLRRAIRLRFWHHLGRMKKHGWFVMASFGIASVRWIILFASKSNWVDYIGTLFIGSGTLPSVVLIQASMNSNMLGYTKRY
jgi:hypothetical protein